jgi:release factor glutamine methyltransferase
MQKFITKSLRRLYSFAAERAVNYYIRKDRSYAYKGLKIKVYKNVFHPGLFRSTKVFARWLESKHVAGANILELGCGSGLLSLIAARKGATVCAVDINPTAVENIIQNAKLNHLDITAFISDLFLNVPLKQFSMVLINPPFFPKAPETDYDHAWFCGENFEYFQRLFSQLKDRPPGEKYYMILSDSCDRREISNIATSNGYRLHVVYNENVLGETLLTYEIAPAAGE